MWEHGHVDGCDQPVRDKRRHSGEEKRQALQGGAVWDRIGQQKPRLLYLIEVGRGRITLNDDTEHDGQEDCVLVSV
jgi:hypothetical protein